MHFGVLCLERLPVEVDADEPPRRSLLLLLHERLFADEGRLLEAHAPPEPELVRRRLLRFDERLVRRDVVDVRHQERGLDAREVEPPDAAGDHPLPPPPPPAPP